MMFPKKKFLKKSSDTPQKERRKIVNACLKLWGALVRSRDGGLCQKCYIPGNQPHHIIPRGTSPNMGWFDLDNGVTLCVNCHKFRGAHATSFETQQAYQMWQKTWLAGKGIDYEIMRIKFTTKCHLDLFSLKVIQAELKKKILADKEKSP
jgi:hypothetical protein